MPTLERHQEQGVYRRVVAFHLGLDQIFLGQVEELLLLGTNVPPFQLAGRVNGRILASASAAAAVLGQVWLLQARFLIVCLHTVRVFR